MSLDWVVKTEEDGKLDLSRIVVVVYHMRWAY